MAPVTSTFSSNNSSGNSTPLAAKNAIQSRTGMPSLTLALTKEKTSSTTHSGGRSPVILPSNVANSSPEMKPSLLVSSSSVSFTGDMEESANHFLKLLLSRPAMVLLRVMPSTRRLMAAARCMKFSLSRNSKVAMVRR